MRPIKVRSSRHRRTIMSPVEAAGSVLDVVEAGGLAVVPLDVSYAFLAGELGSLQRIFELKLRPMSRPCPILASWEQFLDLTKGTDAEIERVKRVVDAGLPVGVITEPNWESDVARSIPALETPEAETDRKGPVDVDAVRPLLVELRGLLETDLAEAMDRLDALRPLLAPTEVGERFERLAEQMDDFDTDEAMESLREIAGALSIPLPEEP